MKMKDINKNEDTYCLNVMRFSSLWKRVYKITFNSKEITEAINVVETEEDWKVLRTGDLNKT